MMPFALWTREAVRDLIHVRFGIAYSLGMVGRLLRRWGFTPQKPVTRAYERKDARIRNWLKREYPALRRRAKLEQSTHDCSGRTIRPARLILHGLWATETDDTFTRLCFSFRVVRDRLRWCMARSKLFGRRLSGECCCSMVLPVRS